MDEDAQKLQVRFVGATAVADMTLLREIGLLRRVWNLAFRSHAWLSSTA